MRMKCICGSLIFDKDSQTCEIYSYFQDQDYYDVLENNHTKVDELINSMPLRKQFLVCNNCGSLYFFKNKRISIFKLETEFLD